MAQNQLCDALALACQVHHDQLDLAGQPYILHVLRVVLACEGEARVVAALHDVVEDGRPRGIVDLTDILARFGSNVFHAVDALTRRTGERYTDYVTRVAANPLAATVKRADLIDNLREDRQPVGESAEKVEARRAKYRRTLQTISESINEQTDV